MDKIMVGDIVKVDPDKVKKSYPSYTEWFNFYKINTERYKPLLSVCVREYRESFRVEWIAPHLNKDVMLYAIQGLKTGIVYLVESDAISDYVHLPTSSDYCHYVNERLLALEVVRLREENDMLKEERDKKKKTKMEVKSESNPMPPLENGWFGFIRKYDENGNLEKENDNEWFVVIKTENKCSMVYKSGGEDRFVDEDYAPFCFENDGVAMDENDQVMAMIVYLCKATSFDTAQYMYKNNLKTCFIDDKEIWRR